VTDTPQAFPLSWPRAKPRTPSPQRVRGRFSTGAKKSDSYSTYQLQNRMTVASDAAPSRVMCSECSFRAHEYKQSIRQERGSVIDASPWAVR